MSQNSQGNQKGRKLADVEEENLLKDAGLWEDGLTAEEKQQLLSCIKESENCAKQEEIKRSQNTSTANESPTRRQSQGIIMTLCALPYTCPYYNDCKKGFWTSCSKSVPEQAKKSQVPVSEEDPVITFESPSGNCRKPLRPQSGSTNSRIGKFSLNGGRSTRMNSELSQFCQGKLFERQTLYKTSSVTIEYVSDPLSSSSQDIVVSETDEEENGHEEVNSVTTNKDTKDQEGLIAPKPTQSTSDESRKSESILGSSSLKLKGNKTKEGINSSKEVMNKNSPNNSANSEDPLVVPESPSNDTQMDCSPNEKAIGPVQRINDNIFNSTKKFGCPPLHFKFALQNEKPTQAYFKVPYETKTSCAKRIYSLITEWQSALAKYQGSLLNTLKWGPPITIDRQIKNNLLKKSYQNNLSPPAHNIATCIDMFSSSSPSDDFVTDADDSDEDFEIFPKKKMKGKKPSKSFLSHHLVNSSTNKQKEPAHEGKVEHDEKESSMSLQNSLESEYPVEDEHEAESQSLLSEVQNLLSEKMEIVSVSSKETTTQRKSFVLSSVEEENESPMEQISPEMFTTQPNPTIRNPDQNLNKSTTNLTKPGMSTEELGECSVASCSALPKTLTRNSIKRKCSPIPLSIPPPKKTAPNKSQENKENDAIPSQIKKFASGNRRKVKECEESSSQECPESNLKQATALPDLRLREKEVIGAQLKSSEGTSQQLREEETDLNLSGTSVSQSSDKIESPSDCGSIESMVECPLCQDMFSFSQIQAHASECDGPPEPIKTRKQSSNLGRSHGLSRTEKPDVYYVETFKHFSSHSKR